MNSFIPDMPPKIFTLSATIVGFLLLDDTSANEQNALGNWLMLVSQILCTNAVYMQLKEGRNQNAAPSNQDTMEMLQKMVRALNQEIEEIKKSL